MCDNKVLICLCWVFIIVSFWLGVVIVLFLSNWLRVRFFLVFNFVFKEWYLFLDLMLWWIVLMFLFSKFVNFVIVGW